ncbi:enoyl-CoA hydratase/isomerase family protein [Steroidobacter flavus]|uniref:Enoyl-CoA hydratase/isomerase family protein n=1 Tax=Steroidobacter flavus TaxID=1842136 RepID=A0ABV8T1S4_9GAMM
MSLPDNLNRRVGQLDIARHGAVTLLTIDRVDKHNALTAEFWGDLRRVLTELEADQQTRAIVLTGAGDKAFCAGGDIAGFATLTTLESKRAYQIDAMNGFAALENCPLPVIAAVNGLALGGGCELTLACDIVLASDRATFGMPEAALGLVPGYGVLRAPHVIGRQMTKLMVMASETLDAQQALQAGLVQRVIPHADLLPKALALAEKVASNSSMAHAVGKRLINRGIERAEFDYSVEALTVLQSSAETQQRVRGFLERRKK